MARIELRDTTIRFKDGFGGTAKVDDLSIASGHASLEIDTVAGLTNGTSIVPVGARFLVTGHVTVYTVTAQDANEKQIITLTDATGGTFTATFDGQTTAGIAYDAAALAVKSALEALSNVEVDDVLVTGSDGGPWTVEFRGQYLATNVSQMAVSAASLLGTNEVQTVSIDDATSGGHFHLTYDGQPTGEIAYDASANDVKLALEALSNIEVDDVSVAGGPGPTADWLVTFQNGLGSQDVDPMTGDGSALTGGSTDVNITTTTPGVTATAAVTTSRPGAVTWELTFTPPIPVTDVPSDGDVITFYPQQLEIKVGDGNVTYTEHRNYEYMLDRGDLDTVREGDQVPVDVKLECVYEHITTGTAEAISPMDALKGVGGASGWVSSSSDSCEPYSIDIEVAHVPPCGTEQMETTLFPDFRADTKEVNFKDATIALTGKCNAVEPDVSRS